MLIENVDNFGKLFDCISNKRASYHRNKIIGADYTSRTPIDFDWYNPHLNQGTTVFPKLVPKIASEVSEVFVMLVVKFTSTIEKTHTDFLSSALI